MDKVQRVEGQVGQFRDEPGKTLADYFRAVLPPGAPAKWWREG